MTRPIAVLDAPSSIGIRPYDDGGARRLDLAPRALRDRGLVERLHARDLGAVEPPPYRDFVRPAGGVRNEREVADYSMLLAQRVASALRGDAFVVLLGGDCSIVLGALLGAASGGRGRPGLAYVDGHADFATPATSRSGSAANMCLAMAVGRGDMELARLGNTRPLVDERNVALLGRREDPDEQFSGEALLARSAILDLPVRELRESGPAAAADRALERLTDATDGFWIHCDADVLDPAVMPAVDSPEPDGLNLDELVALLRPLAQHPRALGLQLTIYDPRLDPDGACAGRLAAVLERVLRAEDHP
ncbi:MAG: arginase family protein [Gemmatimonadota bacterium]